MALSVCCWPRILAVTSCYSLSSLLPAPAARPRSPPLRFPPTSFPATAAPAFKTPAFKPLKPVRKRFEGVGARRQYPCAQAAGFRVDNYAELACGNSPPRRRVQGAGWPLGSCSGITQRGNRQIGRARAQFEGDGARRESEFPCHFSNDSDAPTHPRTFAWLVFNKAGILLRGLRRCPLGSCCTSLCNTLTYSHPPTHPSSPPPPPTPLSPSLAAWGRLLCAAAGAWPGGGGWVWGDGRGRCETMGDVWGGHTPPMANGRRVKGGGQAGLDSASLAGGWLGVLGGQARLGVPDLCGLNPDRHRISTLIRVLDQPSPLTVSYISSSP